MILNITELFCERGAGLKRREKIKSILLHFIAFEMFLLFLCPSRAVVETFVVFH